MENYLAIYSHWIGEFCVRKLTEVLKIPDTETLAGRMVAEAVDVPGINRLQTEIGTLHQLRAGARVGTEVLRPPIQPTRGRRGRRITGETREGHHPIG